MGDVRTAPRAPTAMHMAFAGTWLLRTHAHTGRQGYTADERELMFEDMQRLTTDMFEGITFAPYLPVFNIWAVHDRE